MSIVMKFGGTSVANQSSISQVVQIIKRALRKRPIIITSALFGVTDSLLSLGGKALKNDQRDALLRDLERKHRIQGNVEDELAREFDELKKLTSCWTQKKSVTRQDLDAVASFGERFSSWILVGALLEQRIPAVRIDSREIVVTDSQFGNAEVDLPATQGNFRNTIGPLLRQGKVPVVTGFIGRDKDGNTTTLGRGGSDYTAALTAALLNAREIQIWKDVPGFMTADPRVVDTTRVVPRLSFQEAAELSYFGAKLLHPKTIYPAIQNNIPVRILNTFQPENPGTIIAGEAKTISREKRKFPVTSIASKKRITMITVTSLRMLGPYGFLEKLFRIFSQHRVPVDVVATSEVSVSMTIEGGSCTTKLLTDLETIGSVGVQKKRVIVSIVGAGIKKDPRVEAHIFKTLEREKIPTEMISKGASSINFTFIIEERFQKRAIQALHKIFFL